MGLRTMPHHNGSWRTNKEQTDHTTLLVEKPQAIMIRLMISVVIPTLNAETDLPRTLAALVPAAIDGIVREVIIADGGSSDATGRIAEATGAHFIAAEQGRGQQMASGAEGAKGPWLLFLHADTVLQDGWEREALSLMRAIEQGARPDTAAVFRYALDDKGLWPAVLGVIVRMRSAVFGLPYGDQGLLISKRLYAGIGGFKPIALMEDVDLIRRLGRRRVAFLRSEATTSARRYRSEGYLRRMLRNFACLSLYFLHVPPRVLTRLYG
jgi:rSAM/selenodomain-associated transferase 2